MNKSGFDLANLWLNMVKILIGLVFVYQDTLQIQLNMDMFGDLFYVFAAQERIDQPIDELPRADASQNGRIQELTPSDPVFRVFFLPLTIVERYEHGEIEIFEIKREGAPDNLLDVAASSRIKRFIWPERESDHALQVRRFSLLDLLNDPDPAAGRYDIRFRVSFYGEQGELLFGWPQGNLRAATAADAKRPANLIQVRFVKPEEVLLEVGDLPLVQCQSVDYPYQLKGKWLTKAKLTRRGQADALGVSQVNIEADNRRMRFRALLLPYEGRRQENNYYEMSGSYATILVEQIEGTDLLGSVALEGAGKSFVIDLSGLPTPHRARLNQELEFARQTQRNLYVAFEADLSLDEWNRVPVRVKADDLLFTYNDKLPFQATFVARRNRPPRPIYRGSSGNAVAIYDPRDRYRVSRSEAQASGSDRYYYFNLSRFIVDPDNARGSLELASLAIEGGTDDYDVQTDPATGNFRLRILDEDRIAQDDRIAVRTSDGCSTATITLRIRESEGL